MFFLFHKQNKYWLFCANAIKLHSKAENFHDPRKHGLDIVFLGHIAEIGR